MNSVVNSIIDLKTPNGRRAPHCDKRQFSYEIAVSSPTVFRDITVEHCGVTRKQERRKWNFRCGTLFHFAVLVEAFGQLQESY